MAKRILIFLFIVSVMQNPVFSESGNNASDKIAVYGLKDCISTALENNPRYKNLWIQWGSSILDREIALAPFDPVFTWNLYDSVTKRGGISFESQISGGSESKYLGSDFEISKQLFSGGRWSLKFETAKSESQSFLTEGSLKSYEGKTTLSYSHPLLEGGDIKINRSGIRIAELNAKASEYQRDDFQRELVYQITNSFFETLKAKNAIDVSELSLEEAKTLLETTQAQFDAGYVSAYEVMASESGLASREEALLLAKTSLFNASDSLKNLMGLELDKKIEFSGELKIDTFKPPTINDAYKAAEENRPDFQSLKISDTLALEEYALRKDQVKHMLSLVGQLGFQGEDTNWSNAVGDMSNLSWYLGLNYTVPLGGNKEAVTRLRQSEMNLDSIKLTIEEKRKSISLEITQALRNIDTAKQRVDVTMKGVELLEEKLKQEKARRELGLITSGDLLDYEEDLASAKLRFIEARADYLKALAYLEYVTGIAWTKL